MNWPMVKLGDLGTWTAGGTPPRSDRRCFGGEIPWASIADLNDGRIRETREKLTQLGIEKSSAKMYPAHSLLIAMYGSIGKLGITEVPMASSQAIACFNPQRSLLDLEFAMNVLKWLRPLLENWGRGGTQKNISQTVLKSIEIPLPSLEEQKRIAKILSNVEFSIAVAERQQAEIGKSIRRYVDEVTVASTRQVVHLSEISEITSGITKGRRVHQGVRLTPVPYMAVSNVKDGYLNLNEIKSIDATAEEIERYRLLEGDILLTEGGDPDKLGRGTVWKGEVPDAIHQNHIFKVRLKRPSNWMPDALMAVLGSTQCRSYFLKSAKQTTGIASINKTQLSNTPIALLESSEMQRLQSACQKSIELDIQVQTRQSLLKELQLSLQARCFSGRI